MPMPDYTESEEDIIEYCYLSDNLEDCTKTKCPLYYRKCFPEKKSNGELGNSGVFWSNPDKYKN